MVMTRREQDSADLLRIMDSSDLRAAAHVARTDTKFKPTRGEIAVTLDYLAELKETCQAGDKACMEHRRLNCENCWQMGEPE